VVETLLRRLEKETGVPVEGIDAEAEAVLRRYPWPGNVRELRNTLEQALYVKAEHVIRKRDLPPSILAAAEGEALEDGRTLKDQLRRTEEELIRRALHEARGDKLAVAARLGISKSSLYAKIEQYGLGSAVTPRVD
jgi:transcriptional regulator with PAS, ATPase and Fis domain